MLAASPIAPSSPTSIVLSPGVGGTSFVLWSPTTRPLQGATDTQEHYRKRSIVFFTGVREKVTTISNTPMTHRRIVFMTHARLGGETLYPTTQFSARRVEATPLSGFAVQAGIIFQGAGTIDYDEEFIIDAHVDTERIRVLYDRRRTLNPINTNGTIKNEKYWHPVRKKIIYDDDEVGRIQSSSVWSVESLNAPGNVYILDIFQAYGPGGPATIRYDGTTVYWRE